MVTRRQFALAAALAPALGAQEVRPKVNVKAMVFDTFGTVVDWRGSIIAEGTSWNKAKGVQIDWARLADRWRGAYQPSMNRVRSGELPWTKLDDLHRMSLDTVLSEMNITGWTAAEKEHWVRVWHRLKGWPDSAPGLARLKRKYVIAPMSNGNVALITNMAKFAGLPWDAILGAELVRHYKPDKETYLSAAEFLGVRSDEVMMVAAHRGDLDAARSNGLRTGFIHRPNEYGGVRTADAAKSGEYDVVTKDILDLASQMGA